MGDYSALRIVWVRKSRHWVWRCLLLGGEAEILGGEGEGGSGGSEVSLRPLPTGECVQLEF